MKKAIIDQMMLALFLFSALIIFGATIADNIEARNKVYNLKKLTDNATLAMSKYYSTVNDDTDEAEEIANNMLKNSKLGLQIINSIEYDWDLSSDPITVTATIPDYKHNTFWYKFLDIDNFTMSAVSVAEIVPGGDITDTADLLPFAINGCDESHLTVGSIHTFDLRGERAYLDSSYSEFYGIGTDDDCSASGNSNWAHFKNEIRDFYVENNVLLNDLEKYDVDLDSTLCIPSVSSLGQEQQNDPIQIKNSFNTLERDYDLVGVQADLLMLDCGSTASNLKKKKFVTIEFLQNPSTSYVKGKKGEYHQFQFSVKILESTKPSGGELKK